MKMESEIAYSAEEESYNIMKGGNKKTNSVLNKLINNILTPDNNNGGYIRLVASSSPCKNSNNYVNQNNFSTNELKMVGLEGKYSSQDDNTSANKNLNIT
jgi:hypothetical protein